MTIKSNDPKKQKEVEPTLSPKKAKGKHYVPTPKPIVQPIKHHFNPLYKPLSPTKNHKKSKGDDYKPQTYMPLPLEPSIAPFKKSSNPIHKPSSAPRKPSVAPHKKSVPTHSPSFKPFKWKPDTPVLAPLVHTYPIVPIAVDANRHHHHQHESFKPTMAPTTSVGFLSGLGIGTVVLSSLMFVVVIFMVLMRCIAHPHSDTAEESITEESALLVDNQQKSKNQGNYQTDR